MQYCPLAMNKPTNTHKTTPNSNLDDSILHLEFLGCIDKHDNRFEGSSRSLLFLFFICNYIIRESEILTMSDGKLPKL